MKKLLAAGALALGIFGLGSAINLAGIPSHHVAPTDTELAGIPSHHFAPTVTELAGIPSHHSVEIGTLGIPSHH